MREQKQCCLLNLDFLSENCYGLSSASAYHGSVVFGELGELFSHILFIRLLEASIDMRVELTGGNALGK